MTRATVVLLGLFLILLGAWIAIVPFVGPLFGFGIRNNTAWHWTQTNLVLDVLPGAAIFLGGLMIMTTTRVLSAFGGLLALCGGAWAILGSSTYHVGLTTMLREYGYYYAAGALVVAFAAYVMGLASAPAPVRRTVAAPADASNPEIVAERRERMPGTPASPAPMTPAQQDATAPREAISPMP